MLHQELYQFRMAFPAAELEEACLLAVETVVNPRTVLSMSAKHARTPAHIVYMYTYGSLPFSLTIELSVHIYVEFVGT